MAPPIAEVELEIDAPPARVWSIMLDLPAYAAWNPFIVHAASDGPLVVGRALRLRVRWHDGKTIRSDEVVTELLAPDATAGPARLAYRFAGWLPTLGLVRATRVQQLESLPGARTRYRSREQFGGALARFVPLSRVQDGFVRHAAALKARAEAQDP
jgi:hypothetical protein